MKKLAKREALGKIFSLLVCLSNFWSWQNSQANPQGMTVVSGSAQTSTQGNTLQINTSQTAFLNWNSFNIAAGETTIFNQPSATSIVFNRINNVSPSAIYGSLHANGIVVLQNSAGFYFGPNAFVSANGLVVTTAAINPWSFGGGAAWTFDGPPVPTPIVNYGRLQTASGGSLFLIAKQIDNHGAISAPGGTAALVDGQEVLLSQRADGLSLSEPVKLPAGSVDNEGRIVADAGQVLLQAQTVNNSGVLQANSVREKNGAIELYASQDVELGGSSVIQANGDAGGNSPGGNISIKSGSAFSDSPGSQIKATGGANGGNGGNISLCAPNIASLNSSMDASAQAGFTDGTLFLDPTTIDINSTGAGTIPSSGTELSGSTPSTLTLSPTYLNGFSSIDLQASSSIVLQSPWTVPASSSMTSLTLQAGTGGITFNTGDSLTVQNGATVNLVSGANFSTLTSVTKATSGSSITLSGNASVQTTTGALNLISGGGITIGTGTVETSGGNILLQAQDQNISLGGAQWVLPSLTSPASVTLEAANNLTVATGGGISAGNNWTINLGAGVNNFSSTTTIPVTSVHPTTSTSASLITLNGTLQDAGGNINVFAGGNITLATPWTVAASSSASPTTLTLEAGNNLTLNAGDSLTLGNSWNANLIAGASFSSTTTVTASSATTGSSILLDGTAGVKSSTGNISLTAGGYISGGGVTTAGVTAAGTGSIQSTAGGSITLKDSQSIIPSAAWTLSDSPIGTSPTLTLQAGNNITFGTSDSLLAGQNWSIDLLAGANVNTGAVTGTLTSGQSSITLSGNAGVKTANGGISVTAGNGVTVNNGGIVSGIENGAVTAAPGGNVSVQAVDGNVNCGSSTTGYLFNTTSGYTVNPNLGGMSTANGGNVSIQAGGNISAALPTGSANPTDYGSGAFGPNPGNVTLKTTAGNVTGHYVLADGAGSIQAANAGTASLPLALSLVNGNWLINANAIVMQEVRNPNGVFNSTPKTPSGTPNPFEYLFDYNSLDSVTLNAGSVTITGANLPRPVGAPSRLVFPPALTINAGTGGITLQNSVNLFPSPEGTLNLTTGGGNLVGISATPTGSPVQYINISDSQSVQGANPSTFTPTDANPNPLLHVNDPNPVQINITGSVSDFTLDTPKPVNMTVAGNLTDSSASIQNLHASDISTISVGGQIIEHSDFVLLTLPSGDVPDFNALDQVAELDLPNSNPNILIPNPNLNPVLENQQLNFSYDPAGGSLRYSGKMSLQVEQALLAMSTPFLDASTIETLYGQSLLEPPSADNGYTIHGPGALRITAASMDLGNSGGIVSAGVYNDPALVPYTAIGASLDIAVSGDLSMLASTIESEYGGEVNVTSGGTINLGSSLVSSSNPQHPVGIVSLWEGDISVIADGDINVNGSRIASYDGGNIFVESLQGDVNAGAGGNGLVQVIKPNPFGTGNNYPSLSEFIPGSGILATSFPQLVAGQNTGHIGDITVETPQGNIEASKGGIVQLELGPANNAATITLSAGTKAGGGSDGFIGNVDASGSGVVGGQVNISATGNINGLVVASIGANVSAQQNVTATVLSQGGATVSAGGAVSGTIVGVGSVSVSGSGDSAAAFSAGAVSASGAQSGAAVAAAPTGSSSAAAAATTQQVTQSTQANSDMASNSDEDDLLKKKKKSQLMEYIGRVTVLLPE